MVTHNSKQKEIITLYTEFFFNLRHTPDEPKEHTANHCIAAIEFL